MAENRAHPRTRLSLPVTLYCDRDNQHYDRKISNISMGGLYISGMPCGPVGMQLDISVHPPLSPVLPQQRFPASIVRKDMTGFALGFDNLDSGESLALEDIIWPRWDGQDTFEGLILVASRENITSLGEWLHLTSIVCNQYRRICYHPGSGAGRAIRE